MIECPDITQDEVSRLRSRGIEPSLNELAELIEWGRRVERPPLRTNPLLARAPVAVGCSGLLLPPLTVQAELWMDHALQWFTSRTHVYAIAMAAAIGNKAGAFDGLYRQADGVAAVSTWAKACPARYEELADAVDIILGNEPDPPKRNEDDASTDFGAIIADLAVGTGQTADYWLTRIGPEFRAAVTAVYRAAAMNSGSEFKSGGDDESINAMRGLLQTVGRIRERAAHGQT